MATKIKLTKKQKKHLEIIAKSITEKYSAFHLDKEIEGVRFHITYSTLIGAL